MSINDDTIHLARALRITVDKEVDSTVRALVQAWARAWDTLHDAWADAMMDLATAAHDGPVTPWMIARSERAQAALAAATDEIRGLAEFTGLRITDGTGRIVTATGPAQAQIIASQLPAQAGARAELAARFDRLDPAALGWIVERTTEQVTAQTYKLAWTAQEQMRRALVQGVALGENPRQTARAMLDRAESTFNGGLTRATVIARTEMLDAHRSAAAASQFANEDVLAGWVWQATLDRRTCPSCLSKHGSVHDLAQVGPIDHQQGRCARLPKTKTWAELGFEGLDEPADVLPDAKAWFNALPEADQLAVMGPGRLALLRSGQIEWDDLATRRSTPGWRDSYAPTPVRDLVTQ